MSKLKYIGSHDAVIVPTDHGEISIKKDEAKQFPNSLAKELLKQKANWKKARK